MFVSKVELLASHEKHKLSASNTVMLYQLMLKSGIAKQGH